MSDYLDNEFDDEFEEDNNEEETPLDIDFDELHDLLDEGLESRRPKRKMNPNSLANLQKGGIGDNVKKTRLDKRTEEVNKRMEKMKEDPLEYVKEVLFENVIKEQINLEELQEDLATENGRGNQQRIRNMINMTMQNIIMCADALKAQPKQNKEEAKKSLSTLSQAFEEFRKTLPPDQANDADKFRKKLEDMREEQKKRLENGESN